MSTRGEDHRRQAVGRRVPDVHRDTFTAVPLGDTAEPSFDLGPCLGPCRFDVDAVAFDQRHPQSVRILVELLQRRALRTDESLGEHVVHVTPDALHRLGAVGVAPHRDLEPARRLTQRTRPVGGSGGFGDARSSRPSAMFADPPTRLGTASRTRSASGPERQLRRVGTASEPSTPTDPAGSKTSRSRRRTRRRSAAGTIDRGSGCAWWPRSTVRRSSAAPPANCRAPTTRP